MIGLKAILDKKERTVVGLMSGTSMDGIDTALALITGSGADSVVELVEFATFPYDADINIALKNAALITPEKLSALNFRIGEAFAFAAMKLIGNSGLSAHEIDLIGSHGQTIFHNPPSRANGTPSTLQLGELDVIAKLTGITTVGDFRPADMAVGGEGAPIVPYVDYILHRRPDSTVITQNIGGIANAALITPERTDIVAFDTGPGNMVMDCLVRIATEGNEAYDKDAAIAMKGNVDKILLAELLTHSFFSIPPPKSTGAETFGMSYAGELYKHVDADKTSLNDMVRTALELTVESIARAYEKFILNSHEPEEVILSGGGARNPLLLERLRERLAPLHVVLSDERGVPVEAKEAVAMAVLANELISGNAANVISVTGAWKSVPMGKIALGGKF